MSPSPGVPSTPAGLELTRLLVADAGARCAGDVPALVGMAPARATVAFGLRDALLRGILRAPWLRSRARAASPPAARGSPRACNLPNVTFLLIFPSRDHLYRSNRKELQYSVTRCAPMSHHCNLSKQKVVRILLRAFSDKIQLTEIANSHLFCRRVNVLSLSLSFGNSLESPMFT